MSRGMPSMTALLGLLALAGYQNRDKLAALLTGAGSSTQPGSTNQQGPWAACLAIWAAGSREVESAGY
jgi:hypothetical protein